MGYQRSRHNQVVQNALVKIEGVATSDDAKFFLGKRVAYVYKVRSISLSNLCQR